MTLAATTGTISGAPVTTGTSNFTAIVSDNGNPAQTESVATSIAVTGAQQGPGTTWYVRPDGGTRYSSNVLTGQCDGMGDSPYPGTGVNQHCAFNDFRMLYQDGSYTYGTAFPGWGWVIAGGDTVIVRGSIGTGVSYRVGWNDPSTYCSGPVCWGITGNPYGSGVPVPPSGTLGNPTQILGENYAACATAGAKTQIHGGYGTSSIFNLSGAAYVSVQCLDLTDFTQCTKVGPSPNCSSTPPLDDYANAAIVTNNATSNIVMQDLSIHGLADYGLYGPIGGLVTMTRVYVGYNAFAGWMFDDGNSTPDAPGSIINASYVTMEWNGCNQEYPIVHTISALGCYDTNDGGFGDAWSAQGTGSGGQISNLSMTCDQCIARYNTKDGFGMNHIGFTNLSITNSAFYGNMGQQVKWQNAYKGTTIFRNNLVLSNCNRMSVAFPGTPTSYNAGLTGFCRAGVGFETIFPNNGFLYFDSNTIVAANPNVMGTVTCGVDVTGAAFSCAGSTNEMRDNIFLGYTNPNTGTYNGSTITALCYTDCAGTPGTSTDAMWAVRSNNIWYGFNTGIPESGNCTYAGEICTSPLLVNQPSQAWIGESEMDNFDYYPALGSPAIGAGTTYTGIPATDYYGVAVTSPSVIGAVN